MTDRPLLIAHRGASGYLPEHTLPAKALAYGLGADFLEQDVVATRDDELVVLHDIHLDTVTDVALRFPERSRTMAGGTPATLIWRRSVSSMSMNGGARPAVRPCFPVVFRPTLAGSAFRR